jgi:hypothetical protein
MKKILEFLEESNGRFSSSRLFALLVTIATIVDWMHAVFTDGVWTPEWQTIGMVLGVLGFKVAQKSFGEKETGTTTTGTTTTGTTTKSEKNGLVKVYVGLLDANKKQKLEDAVKETGFNSWDAFMDDAPKKATIEDINKIKERLKVKGIL